MKKHNYPIRYTALVKKLQEHERFQKPLDKTILDEAIRGLRTNSISNTASLWLHAQFVMYGLIDPNKIPAFFTDENYRIRMKPDQYRQFRTEFGGKVHRRNPASIPLESGINPASIPLESGINPASIPLESGINPASIRQQDADVAAVIEVAELATTLHFTSDHDTSVQSIAAAPPGPGVASPREEVAQPLPNRKPALTDASQILRLMQQRKTTLADHARFNFDIN